MYSAAAGMAAQQARLDATSNDLANVDTTGYRHARVAFRDLVYTQAARGAVRGVEIGAGAAATYIGRSTEQGAFQETSRSLDAALQGPGFLEVKLANGQTALTRDGHLRTDAQGRLCLTGGQLLQPPVTVPAGTTDDQIRIGPDGTVSVAKRTVGKLNIVEVPAPGALMGGPDNTLLPNAASGAPRAARQTTIQTGVLEASNVDVGTAMTQMIETQRAFQFAGKAISTQDQLLQIANEVKR
jgi:flagellar basal-body rod protein FlgG